MAPAPTSDSPARPRGAARREALLQATLRVIAQTGADAVTHRAIAAEAGLPLASTTYHFASKDEILTEALRYASQLDIDQLHAVAARFDDQPVGPREIVAVLTHPSELPAAAGRASLLTCYSLLLEAARRPALRELTRAWADAYLATVSHLLGAAGSRRPAEDARLLLGALDGLSIDRLASGAADDTRAELERLAAILLAAPGAPR